MAKGFSVEAIKKEIGEGGLSELASAGKKPTKAKKPASERLTAQFSVYLSAAEFEQYNNKNKMAKASAVTRQLILKYLNGDIEL